MALMVVKGSLVMGSRPIDEGLASQFAAVVY
jgi:hypothetical protein